MLKKLFLSAIFIVCLVISGLASQITPGGTIDGIQTYPLFLSDLKISKEFYNYSSTTFAQCAPYDTAVSGTANLGLDNNTSQEWLFNGPKYRIRQDGTISEVRLYVAAVTNITAIYVKVWRKNIGGTYDLVNSSENILSKVTAGVGNIIRVPLSTPITGVQEGDYYGVRVEGSASAGNYQFFARTSQATVTTYSVVNAAPGASAYDWAAQTATAGTTLPIELYMTSPQMVLIGDSLMAGVYDHYGYCQTLADISKPSSSIAYQLKALTGYTYQNMGIPGDSTTGVAGRITADCINANPIFAVLQGGINDILGGGTQAQHITRWTTILNACQNAGIVPIVMLMWPAPQADVSTAQMTNVDAWNAALVTLTLSYPAAIVIDMHSGLGQYRADGPAGNLWDLQAAYKGGIGGHLNAAGYGVVASAIAAAVRNYDTNLVAWSASGIRWSNPQWPSLVQGISELLTNPDFETGAISPWVNHQYSTPTVINYGAQKGGYCADIASDGAHTNWSFKQLTSTSITGQWYRASVYSYMNTMNTALIFKLYNKAANVTYYSSEDFYDTSYTKHSCTARSTGTTGFLFLLQGGNSPAAAVSFRADNCSIQQLPFSGLVNCLSFRNPNRKTKCDVHLVNAGALQAGLIFNSDCSFAANVVSSSDATHLVLNNVSKAITATSTLTIAGVTYSITSVGALSGGTQSVVLSGAGYTGSVGAGQYVGVNQDNANYCLAYHDKTNIHMVMVINGVYQAESINQSNTYADWKTIEVDHSGNNAQLYYNGVSINTIDISATGNNPWHGLFRTGQKALINNFSISPF